MKLKMVLPWFGITAICGIGVGAAQAGHLNHETQLAVSAVLSLFSTAPCVIAFFFRQGQPERFGIDLIASTLAIYAATLLLSGFVGNLFTALLLGKQG